MTYIPGALTGVGIGDLTFASISSFTKVMASDITVTDLDTVSGLLNSIDISNLSSYQTVWSGVTRNVLWIP